MKKVVLGIAIDDVSQNETLSKVCKWVETVKDDPKLVATVGPEFLVTAQRDEEFASTLNEFDLNIPEGFGLRFYGQVVNRIPGIDFMLALCTLADEKKWRIGLLGSVYGVAEKAGERLSQKFPGAEFAWCLSGERADQVLQKPGLLRNQSKVDLLFVAFGHPKQEKFLKQAKREAPGVFRVGVGVGGSLDYLSGLRSPIPRLLAPIGLEWLGRLLLNPGHFWRIWRATIIFPWLLFWSRFR